MRRENDGCVGIWNFVELFNEDRALGLEALDHIAVMHDLVAHVDRRAVAGERLLDRIDGAHDTGAEAARRAQQHRQRGLGGFRHGTSVRRVAAPLDMGLCAGPVKRGPWNRSWPPATRRPAWRKPPTARPDRADRARRRQLAPRSPSVHLLAPADRGTARAT